jgi:hypothetical protein
MPIFTKKNKSLRIATRSSTHFLHFLCIRCLNLQLSSLFHTHFSTSDPRKCNETNVGSRSRNALQIHVTCQECWKPEVERVFYSTSIHTYTTYVYTHIPPTYTRIYHLRIFNFLIALLQRIFVASKVTSFQALTISTPISKVMDGH